MKHTTEELLLAVHIRELAIAKMNSAFSVALQEADLGNKDFKTVFIAYTPEEKRQEKREEQAQVDHQALGVKFKKDWYASKTICDFVPAVVADLNAIAEVTKESLAE